MERGEGHRHCDIGLGYCWPDDILEGGSSSHNDVHGWLSGADDVNGWRRLIFLGLGWLGNQNHTKKNYRQVGTTVCFSLLRLTVQKRECLASGFLYRWEAITKHICKYLA